jgi:hypothetical protein
MSQEAPGAILIIMSIGRVGYSCANAGIQRPKATTKMELASNTTTIALIILFFPFMILLLL